MNFKKTKRKTVLGIVISVFLLFVMLGCSDENSGTENKEQGGKEKNEIEKDENKDKKEEPKKDEKQDSNEQDNKDSGESKKDEKKKETNMKNVDKRPVIIMKTQLGDKELAPMKFELYPDKAPITVANFIKLSKDKYYDGLIFHRIIKNFMIQGGDPDGTGMGGPGYAIKGEFASNGVENDLSHLVGVISMARSQMPDSAGSQFFIVHKEAPHLDGEYAAFGQMLEGFETLNELAEVETDSDRPIVDCKIISIEVEDNGYILE